MGKDARILIVDDERSELDALTAMLERAGYANVSGTTDSSQVLGLCAETTPDLLLLDLEMPQPDGFEVMELLHPWIEGRSFPVVALVDGLDDDARARAISAGARELVAKPAREAELLLRIGNMLDLRFLQRELRRQNLLLEQEVESRTRDHKKGRLEILERLAVAAEYRDDETGEHGERVGRTSALIAQGIGFPRDQIETIRFAAPLHDIGKLGVPESVLHKREGLSEEEFEVMKRHVTIGRLLLGGTDLAVLQMAEQIAASHHEWWDGSGYVAGLKGKQIPLVGRIVAVADVFDALTHDRPFKAALGVEQAIEEIKRLSGRQFDPEVVRVFERLEHETLI